MAEVVDLKKKINLNDSNKYQTILLFLNINMVTLFRTFKIAERSSVTHDSNNLLLRSNFDFWNFLKFISKLTENTVIRF